MSTGGIGTGDMEVTQQQGKLKHAPPHSWRFNIPAHASIRFLGATAVGSAEVSSGRRTEEGGVELARSAPLKEYAGVRDTLKIPDVVTRFLAAEVCPATTRECRPRRTKADACRPPHASPPRPPFGQSPP